MGVGLARHRRAAQPPGGGEGAAGRHARARTRREIEESRQRILREGRIGARLQHAARHQHVRRRGARRPAVAGDGVPAVDSLATVLREKGPLLPVRAAAIGRAGGRRAGRRARRRRGAPRRQAGQRPHRRRRPGQAHRLRGLPRGRRRAAHPHRPDRGHPRVPGPRDRAGPHPDRRLRRVRARRHPVRRRRGRARRSGSTTTPTRCCTRSPPRPRSHRSTRAR